MVTFFNSEQTKKNSSLVVIKLTNLVVYKPHVTKCPISWFLAFMLNNSDITNLITSIVVFLKWDFSPFNNLDTFK